MAPSFRTSTSDSWLIVGPPRHPRVRGANSHRSNAFRSAPMDTPRKSPVIQRGGHPAVKTPAGAGPVFSVLAWLPSGNACALAAGSRTDPVEGERHEPEPSAHVIAACRGGNLSLLGQTPLLAFFRPVICEPV